MPGLKALPPPGKANFYGIEVTQGITWQGWTPGKEYTKSITFKNVLVKTQKLKYKVPATRFFSTLYPQPIVLSAGTSYTLPVTFRPLEKIVYNDAVEVATSEGTFSIPVKAVLPQMSIEAPEKINFNMCAAHDMLQLTFEIKNTSELTTPFQVDCLEPFFIEPSEGVMEPFSSFVLTATFKPKAAVVYDAHAVIKYGNDSAEITQLTGIGKYPHLFVPSSALQEGTSNLETVINFGSVHIGQSSEKWIELQNMSPVNAPFTVDHPSSGNIDTVFECHQHHGIVPAMSSLRVPVTFKPSTVNSSSVDYFHVKAVGNVSKTIIKCVGKSRGPKVELSQKVVNFMTVDAGKSSIKVLDVINHSDADVSFQFLIDCSESPFKFEHVSGTLPAKSKKTLKLKFEPFHPINYHKRVVCLVHQQNPIFVDLIGTCHTETIKPAVLQSKHLKRYRIHVDRGFSFMPPEQLNAAVREGKMKLDDRGCVYDPNQQEQDLDRIPAELHPMEEYFNDGHHCQVMHSTPHVSLDTLEAAFGRVTDPRLPQQQTVTLTNHTKGKVTVCWMGGPQHVFTVTPSTVDIPPEGSAPFTVTFKPGVPNQFFGSLLECYVYYKSLRDYRMVEDSTHFPPWCLNIHATGHTFPEQAETYLPRFRIDSRRVVFPAVNVGEATYRTVLLDNVGPTPIYYSFDNDTTGIYTMKPTKGVLPPGQCQVYMLKVVPTEVKTYRQALKLRLNDADKNTQEISVLGSAEAPDVLLGHGGVLYFKPTCLGTTSTRQYCVQNQSRIPLRYEWKLTHAEKQLLKVTPEAGVILPNENQYHTWQFIPKKQEKYVLKPTLVVWGQGQSGTSSGGKKKAFSVRAIAQGSIGEIKAETTYIDFNTVVVGSKGEKKMILYNHSDCSLQYHLNIDQKIENDDENVEEPLALELDTTTGVLPAHSRTMITALARPGKHATYTWTISYRIITPQGCVDELNEPQHLCHMLATGVHPCMQVVDARCYGSAIGISKKQLWSLFNLDQLNTTLDTEPHPQERMSVSRRRYRPPTAAPATPSMDFNFSAAPLDCQPCVVQLQVENKGDVPCEWQFLMPNDLQLELPLWSETADYDSEELHHMKVLDNKLFTIEPKKGKLQPGDSQTITLSYRHILTGTDRLPVLLKLSRGREILINFVGVTVEPDRRYIHFPSNRFLFNPVPIGEKNSPKQIYELYNGGAVPLKYEFNLMPLEVMKQDNYDHAIFDCLNPVGEISPGQTANIEWCFSPLEAKTYSVDVPIRIDQGDTALVTFEGIGYDKRQLGDTMKLTDCPDTNTSIPDSQVATVPGQLVYLSKERLSFGNLPLFSHTYRQVALHNRSHQHAVRAVWHVTNTRDMQIVTISPSELSLGPGERKMCRLTFTAVGVPSFYDIDLICEVMNMTEHMVFEKEMKKWERELQRQKEEFTITEYDLDADKRLYRDPETRPPSSRLRSLELSQTALSPTPEEIDFAKYKTLPPIKQQSVEIERMHERARRQVEALYWARPVPPTPFLLHLGITARTHDVAHFQHNFPHQYKNFYIDSKLWDLDPRALSELESGVKQQGNELTPQVMSCTEAEADVVAGALASIIRGLLDDTEFHEGCEKVISAETPYYMQFVDKPLPRPITPSPPAVICEFLEADSEKKELQEKLLEHERIRSPSSPATGSLAGAGSIRSSQHGGSRSHHGSRSHSLQSTTRPGSGMSELAASIAADLAQSSTADPTSSSVRSSPGPNQSRSSQPMSATSSQRATSAASASTAMSRRSEVSTTMQPIGDVEEEVQKTQALKKLPEFGSLVESLLENTITNIITEAFCDEVNLTAHPRLVALRQSRPNSGPKTNSKAASALSKAPSKKP